MALSLDSKIRDIMRSEEGKAVMEKYTPGSTKDPRMKLVGALTYRKLLSYPESAETAKFADQIDEDLKKWARQKILCKRYSTKSRIAHNSCAEWGLFPLFASIPVGWGGMRAEKRCECRHNLPGILIPGNQPACRSANMIVS